MLRNSWSHSARHAHHKMIWSDETSVVLGKYGMQSVTRRPAEKFDESCLAYRYDKAMNFIFVAK